jgi:hypothetical protein
MTEGILRRLETMVSKGEDKDAVAAAKLLLGYGWGQPKQSLDANVKVEDMKRLTPENYAAEDLGAAIEAIKSRK